MDESKGQAGGVLTPVAMQPCPLCHAAVRLADLGGWEVLCNCGIVFELPSDAHLDREATIAAWNRRPTPAVAAVDPRCCGDAGNCPTDYRYCPHKGNPPAAAAGVPTGWKLDCRYPCCDCTVNLHNGNGCKGEASPVAPAGAPTDQKDAWHAVVDALSEVCPKWTAAGYSGIESAVNTIKRLAREAAVPRYQMHPCGLWVGQRVRANVDLVNDMTSEGMGRSIYARRGDVLVVRDFSEHRTSMFVKVSHEDVTGSAFTARFNELEPIDALLSAGSQGEQHDSSHEAAPQSSAPAPRSSLPLPNRSVLPREPK